MTIESKFYLKKINWKTNTERNFNKILVNIFLVSTASLPSSALYTVWPIHEENVHDVIVCEGKGIILRALQGTIAIEHQHRDYVYGSGLKPDNLLGFLTCYTNWLSGDTIIKWVTLYFQMRTTKREREREREERERVV